MPGSDLLRFALEVAHAGAAEILPRFQNCAVSCKEDGSVVTDADLAAERAMRRLIEQRYPGDAILGEEEGGTPCVRGRTWILDPLDGTTSFSFSVPKFGTLVALLEEDQPVLGVIHLPITCESIYAETGCGCWSVRYGSAPQRVRVDKSVERLTDASISLAGVGGCELRDVSPTWRCTVLVRAAAGVEFIGDCVQYALLAKGRIHAAIDPFMRPWDTAALIPCITEAGGITSLLDGRRSNVVFGGSLVASCSARLHDEILSAIHV